MCYFAYDKRIHFPPLAALIRAKEVMFLSERRITFSDSPGKISSFSIFLLIFFPPFFLKFIFYFIFFSRFCKTLIKFSTELKGKLFVKFHSKFIDFLYFFRLLSGGCNRSAICLLFKSNLLNIPCQSR